MPEYPVSVLAGIGYSALEYEAEGDSERKSLAVGAIYCTTSKQLTLIREREKVMETKLSYEQVKESVKILSDNHQETAYQKDIEFEYEGERYSICLVWDRYQGFEIIEWGNTPNELREAADGYIATILDELAYQFKEGK